MTFEQMLADYSANPTVEGMTAIRAALAKQPCDGTTNYITYPAGGNGIGRVVPCGYVFNDCGDSVRCVPCEIRRQQEQFTGPDASPRDVTVTQSPAPQSSVTLTQGAKKETRVEVKVYAADVAEAARLAREQYDALVKTYAATTD
jgi:hypothetical protein